jgi:hypothetical protein
MARLDGEAGGMSSFRGLVLLAAAFCMLVSITAAPVGSDDAAQPAAAPGPISAARIRLREGVSPADLGGGAAGGMGSGAAAWSDDGLVETAGVTAAGGKMVHLHGRYRTSAVMKREGSGPPSTECIANAPAEGR